MTDKQLLARVKYWVKRMGLEHLQINVKSFRDSEDNVAGSALPNPQYRSGVLRFNLGHEEMKISPDIVIKHELAHLMVAMFAQAAMHAIEDPTIKKILEDLEDEIVTSISWMPALAE